MISKLRQRHRRVFIALGVFLPVAFAIGIAARQPAPGAGKLPIAPDVVPRTFATAGDTRPIQFAKAPVQAKWLRAANEPGRFAIELTADRNFVKPDLIVYWVAGNPNSTDALPEDAFLLGAFGPTALFLPKQATNASGVLVLYSLADGEIVDVSQPFSVQPLTNSKH